MGECSHALTRGERRMETRSLLWIGLCLVSSIAGAPRISNAGSFVDCAMSPTGIDDAMGCRSDNPGFVFDAYFSTWAVPPGLTWEWTIAPNLGSPPTIVSGCTSNTTFCDLVLTTSSMGPTKVTVTVNIYQPDPYHSAPGVLRVSYSASARAPCTTVKQGNHPTMC